MSTYTEEELRLHIRVALKMALGAESIGVHKLWYDEMTETIIAGVNSGNFHDPTPAA